jgi:hypothetical protein
MGVLDDTHEMLLEAALRQCGQDELQWLRGAAELGELRGPWARLHSAEGSELFERALRDHQYDPDDLRVLPELLGWLASRRSLRDTREGLRQLVGTNVAMGSGSAVPAELLNRVVTQIGVQGDLALTAYSLHEALQTHAPRLFEQRARLVAAHAGQRSVAAALIAKNAPPSLQSKAAALVPSGPLGRGDARIVGPTNTPASEPSAEVQAIDARLTRAREWLSATEDAMRDMTAWLTRTLPRSNAPGWSQLMAASRGCSLDGLARRERRLFRLSEGVRRLGFERDLNARIHSEPARVSLSPDARAVALRVPGDLRLAQTPLEYGLWSDLGATRGMGEALALSLISPAERCAQRWPFGSGLAPALGALLVQLRAEPAYLRTIEDVPPSGAEPLARLVAIVGLLHTRLTAALALAEAAPARDDQERLAQLMAAAERALGCALPGGLLALVLLGSRIEGHDFDALDLGLRLHEALREHYDEDWYRNPRVGEVIRGACARGNRLSGSAWLAELGANGPASYIRAMALLR